MKVYHGQSISIGQSLHEGRRSLEPYPSRNPREKPGHQKSKKDRAEVVNIDLHPQ